jgi:hypothetical protein
MAIYDRDKATFFTASGGVVAPDRLTNEVEEQILSPSLTSITDSPADAPDVCRFDFNGTLSGGQEATLDSVCNAHSGEPLPVADMPHARLHGLSSTDDHIPAPLALFNALIVDATLDDASSSRPPTQHAIDGAAHSGQLAHSSLSGIGADDHHAHANKAQLDLVSDGDHDVRTDNPHGVTPVQVGNATAQWNADKLQGSDVASDAPSDGQVLTFRPASGWGPEAAAGGFAEWYYAEDDGNDSTTSGNFQIKVELDETFDGGTYAIEWYYEHWNGTIWKTTRTAVMLDDSEYLAFHDYRMTGDYTEDAGGGVRVVDLTPGSHNIKMGFCQVDGGVAYIRRARILARKVSD